jgi:hypothetical protein
MEVSPHLERLGSAVIPAHNVSAGIRRGLDALFARTTLVDAWPQVPTQYSRS